MTIEFDDRELKALALDLGDGISKDVRDRVKDVMKQGASDLKKKWQANAKESAGAHGHLYPYSIDFDQVTGARSAGGQFSRDLEFEVGPNEEKRVNGRGSGVGGFVGKAGAGYEFGSANQPPHLDGQRAADDIVPLLERRIGIAAEDVFDA